MSMPRNAGPGYTGKHRRPGALGTVGGPGRDSGYARIDGTPAAGSKPAPAATAPWPQAARPLDAGSWPELGTRSDAR